MSTNDPRQVTEERGVNGPNPQAIVQDITEGFNGKPSQPVKAEQKPTPPPAPPPKKG